MHDAPKASAARTPCQATTGCGAFQRSSPTGGAAKGMPLNTRTPFAAVPEIWPPSTATISGAADVEIEPTAIARAIIQRRMRPPGPAEAGRHDEPRTTNEDRRANLERSAAEHASGAIAGRERVQR